jgi:DNA polymerase-1
MKDHLIDAGAVVAKYGITPEQFIDYLALMGDSSDNIPGVRGIGPVAAQKLLQKFGSLENIYSRLDEAEPKYRSKLEENRENAFLSQHLARIIQDAGIALPDISELSFDPAVLYNALPFIKRYEITSLQRKIEARAKAMESAVEPEEEQADIFEGPAPASEDEAPEPEMVIKRSFEAILVDSRSFPQVIAEISKAQIVSLDTETDALDSLTTNLVGISLCCAEDKAWYLPYGHQLTDNLPMDNLPELWKALSGKQIGGTI